MKCEEAKRVLPLLLYGELDFDHEEQLEAHLDGCEECRAERERGRALFNFLDAEAVEVPQDLLRRSRRQLGDRLSVEDAHETWWTRLTRGFTIHVRPLPGPLQAAGAVAMLALGFFGAKLVPQLQTGGPLPASTAGFTEPVASHIRYVEPEASGQVQIVMEETRQRVIRGNAADADIQDLLVEAAKSQDPGLRVQSVDLLTAKAESPEVRDALLYAVQHDPNAGVRLKALDGLRQWSDDAETRRVLSQVLLKDANPGVRTQVVDILVQRPQEQMVGVMQELMRRERNGYVRMRCERALRDMNASVETY